MAVTIYRSTDGSAPVLTGENGKLNDLLYACLVTGYGAKSALGWTRPYNDAGNFTSAFLAGSGSTSAYVRVDDGSPGAGGAKEAAMTGYQTMTDIDTGTGGFGGSYVRKSASADTTARSWILIGTTKIFHLFIYNGDVSGYASPISFGDCYSYKSADLYRAVVIGRNAANTASNSASSDAFGILTNSIGSVTAGNNIMRSYTGIGSGVTIGKHSNYYEAAQTVMGNGGATYPCPVDGGLLLAPTYLHEPSYTRGELPGIWVPLHTQPLLNGDTFSGVGGLSSKTFEVVNIYTTGQCFIETSNTWSEN